MDQYNQGQQQAQHTEQSARQDNPTFIRDLICSIIQLVFCLFLTGLPALIMTILSNRSWEQRRYDFYKKQTKATTIILIIGWIYLGIEALVLFGGFFYFVFDLGSHGY